MTIETITATLTGEKVDGSPSDHPVPVRLLGAPTRRLGLFGDDLEVIVKAEDWPPADVPLDARGVFTLTIGVPGNGHSLGGYLLRSWDVYTVGKASGATPAATTEYRVRLSTFPATYREGRGGRITVGTINVVDEDGAPDTGDASFHTNSELAAVALDAIGEPYSIVDAALMDQFDPPGPLDWGNAHAPAELEALLARIGYRAHPDNAFDRAIRVVPLPQPGDSPNIPQAMLDIAEPFELTTAPPITGTKIVVTSGDTRAVIMEARNLDDFEWVWFDEESGAWKNAAETVDGLAPNDIDAFKLGPGESIEARQEFGRLFSAIRLTGEDADALKRLVPMPKSVSDVAGFDFSGRAVAIRARVMRDQGQAQFRNDPESDEDDPIVITGVAADADAGVIVLPRDVVFARMTNGTGSYADARELTGDDLTVLFAHEANSDTKTLNYFVAGWEVQGGQLVEVTDQALLDMWTDPTSIVIAAPFLRNLLTPSGGPNTYITQNGAALKAIALQLAQQRVGAALAESGIVPLRGLQNVQPGDWDGAVSSVSWDVNAFITNVSVNEHTVPDSVMQQLEAAANRSFITGLSRFGNPGAHASKREAQGGPSVRGFGSSLEQEGRGGDRGAERARGVIPIFASPNTNRPSPRFGSFWALTGAATSIGPNRWAYDWQQVIIADDGTATVVANGRTSASHGQAINLAEMMNTGAGVEGNGVDRANLPETFEMQPIAPQVVPMSGPYGDDGAARYVFHSVNTDDGPCPEAEAIQQFTDDDAIETLLLAGGFAS
tara:strand:- start:118 stop:2451 length:2334 start_codon:yes stop_codon:yes gene_type:complete